MCVVDVFNSVQACMTCRLAEKSQTILGAKFELDNCGGLKRMPSKRLCHCSARVAPKGEYNKEYLSLVNVEPILYS